MWQGKWKQTTEGRLARTWRLFKCVCWREGRMNENFVVSNSND